MEKKRLIGDDAQLIKGELETETVGDGTSTLDELAGDADSGDGAGFYVIKAKSASSAFDSTVQSAQKFEVGNIFIADGSEVLKVGDKAARLKLTPLLDCSGWSITFTANEVETTVLNDSVKKYRKGKSDADGNVKFIYIQGISDAQGGLVNKFLKIINKASDNKITISNIDNSPLYIKGDINKYRSSGETHSFVFAQVELYGVKLGADMGAAQEGESKMRLVGADPILYNEEIA